VAFSLLARGYLVEIAEKRAHQWYEAASARFDSEEPAEELVTLWNKRLGHLLDAGATGLGPRIEALAGAGFDGVFSSAMQSRISCGWTAGMHALPGAAW
jgi:hypothetical protein